MRTQPRQTQLAAILLLALCLITLAVITLPAGRNLSESFFTQKDKPFQDQPPKNVNDSAPGNGNGSKVDTSAPPSAPKDDQQLATTGKVWTALKRFDYQGVSAQEFVKSQLTPETFASTVLSPADGQLCCKKWVVITTIFDPSKTIQQVIRLSGWCAVIVGDKKTPEDKYQSLVSQFKDNVVYLTVEMQKQLPYSMNSKIPWNHFGRKNLGYLYAIHHCAVDIYDCDDDNELTSDSLKTVGEFVNLSEIKLPSTASKNISHSFFNPYASFVDMSVYTASATWPRGFPLSLIKSHQNAVSASDVEKLTVSNRLALVQSLASIDPDMDAIYRLSQPLPLKFDQSVTPVVMNERQYAPLNAQALMTTRQSFFGLLLPISVHGRVTDIWRSYIWIRILHDIDAGQVAFAAPWVEHRRNEHSYDADFVAEYPLYTQTKAFVQYLDQITFRPDASIPERLLQIYIQCYEIGVIGQSDIDLVMAWLKDLHSVGYQFPEPVIQSKSLSIWSSDLHDGVRADISSVLMSIGQRYVNAGAKGLSGPYPEVFVHPHSTIAPRAPLIEQRTKHTMSPLTEPEVKQFYQDYTGNEVMQQTSAFVCSFVSSFCEAYMPMNRSIIFLPAHRFTMGRCSENSWKRLIEHVQLMAKPKQGAPTNIIAAMGKYDAEYIKYYTGVEPLILPATSFAYTQNTRYYPRRKEILVGPLQLQGLPYESEFNIVSALGQSEKWKFVTAKQLYGRYTLDNIADHRAVVILPYAVLSYGLTELAAIGVPIFVPSVDFLLELGLITDRVILSSPLYCSLGQDHFVIPQHPNSSHKFSPEDESLAAKKYWLQYADFYQWKNVIQFDSWKHLATVLDKTDFNGVHKAMVRYNVQRRQELYKNWRHVIDKIGPNLRDYPKSYQDALQMWGVESIMSD
ncbi:hypothetical protein MP228_012403 [Amoeboaphelidium protococcarum]|nr:hypothetical protein MP228_012403 [Amoeboaphelidium protococcarum]